jgi:hypothetical protein
MQHTVRAMGDDLDKNLGQVLSNLRDSLAKVPQESEPLSVAGCGRAMLAEENPDALWPDGLDDAFIGLAHRCGQPTLAAFSIRKCIEVLMKRDGMTYEEADEYVSFNATDAWCGPGTPVWVDDCD